MRREPYVMYLVKFIVKLTGLIFILLAIICNPFFMITQPPSFVKFDNLIYIKIFIVFMELLLFTLGIIWFFKSEQIVIKIKYVNPIFVYRNKKKEFVLLIAACIVCLIILELFSRFLFAVTNQLPFTYSVEEMIYPSLYNIKQNYTDEGVNILLLGGSVLFANSKFLKEKGRRYAFNFYNAAYIAHTTLDSVYKYKYLLKSKLKFDYVIFYHGINDVRLNNIPSAFFQNNYDHYYYYKLINKIFNDKDYRSISLLNSTLAYNLYNLFYRFYSLTRFRKTEFMPYDIPARELTQYGGAIKTTKAFKNNLSELIKMANREKAVIIAPYFAFQQTFVNTEMTRIWGKPQHVVKGIKYHNMIITEMRNSLVTIDTKQISADKSNFLDICHFSKKGKKIFGELIINKLLLIR